AVLLADQVAYRTAVIAVREHRGGARVDAELVLDRDATDVVARAQSAVLVDEELRHNEEGYTLDPRKRIRRAREHEMDDVVGVVVLAVRDEDLLAEELVRAVALRHGAGAYRGQIRPGLRLGQVHRAGPRARDHLLEIALLQHRRATEVD